MKLCIIDTKSANLNSVVQALKRLDVEPIITSETDILNSFSPEWEQLLRLCPELTTVFFMILF